MENKDKKQKIAISVKNISKKFVNNPARTVLAGLFLKSYQMVAIIVSK